MTPVALWMKIHPKARMLAISVKGISMFRGPALSAMYNGIYA